MGRVTARRRVSRLRLGEPSLTTMDTLVVEEPLEIRVAGSSLAVTMRTPGNDFELAAGFLVSEGVISSNDQLFSISYCGGEKGPNSYNIVGVTLRSGVPLPDPSLARAFFTTSSCGLCGKASIDAVRTRSAYPIATDRPMLEARGLANLPEKLRAEQAVFDKTGGLHAAGLFDARTGDVLVVREDVGRHNAVDKVVGWALTQDRLPASESILMVSGRASFELVQKASMAGIPVLTAVSAPSSLAVDLAVECGITLVGFLRGQSMVVYAGEGRFASSEGLLGK